MAMNDYEIDKIRRIRHRISAEHGHGLWKIAEHYHNLEINRYGLKVHSLED